MFAVKGLSMPDNITCEVDGVKEYWKKQNYFAMKYGMLVFLIGLIFTFSEWKRAQTEADLIIGLLKLIWCLFALALLAAAQIFPDKKAILVYISFLVTLVRSNLQMLRREQAVEDAVQQF